MKQLFDGLFALVISCTYFFIAWQMERLHAYIVLGFYVLTMLKFYQLQAFMPEQFDNVTLDEKDKLWHKEWYE